MSQFTVTIFGSWSNISYNNTGKKTTMTDMQAQNLLNQSTKLKRMLSNKWWRTDQWCQVRLCSRTSRWSVIDGDTRGREMRFATQEFPARKPQSAWLYSSAASTWGWGKSCSFPPSWLRSLPLSHRRTCTDQPQIINLESGLLGPGEAVMREPITTHFKRPSKCAGVPGTMVLMKNGCWPWLSS